MSSEVKQKPLLLLLILLLLLLSLLLLLLMSLLLPLQLLYSIHIHKQGTVKRCQVDQSEVVVFMNLFLLLLFHYSELRGRLILIRLANLLHFSTITTRQPATLARAELSFDVLVVVVCRFFSIESSLLLSIRLLSWK